MKEGAENREGVLERLFQGNSRKSREDRAREYVIHRVRQGVCLNDALQEEYVQRKCNKDELDEIVRDPRLIHEERETLERFFSEDRVDPAHAIRRR
jgi:hypothetical protein